MVTPVPRFAVTRPLYNLTDEELLDQFLRMAPWWRNSATERAPVRAEILRRMQNPRQPLTRAAETQEEGPQK
jgi:hypothetical protein